MTTLLKQIEQTVKHWYLPLIAGILLIIFGCYLFATPLGTFLTLGVLFSTSFLVAGIFDIYFSIANRGQLPGWGWYLTGGIFSLLTGILLLAYPSLSLNVLSLLVGFGLLFRSFYALGASFDLKDQGAPNWGWITFLSILGIISSFLLIANPLVAGLSLVYLVALSFILAGISSISLSAGLKAIRDIPDKTSGELKKRFAELKQEYVRQIRK